MPVTGRILAIALTVACGAAQAADLGADPLTTPTSPLYQPSPDVRAQVKDVMGRAHRQPRPAELPALPEAEAGVANPVPPTLVLTAQRELAAMNYDVGPLDGVAGPKTRQAVMAFQRDNGLPADGRLTFDLLNKLMVRPAPVAAAAPPPPAPAEPAVVTFSTRRAIGKTVHDLPGDLLGTVADFVVNADRTLAGIVVATTNGYGTHEGKVMVPFAQVRQAITRVAVVLPLDAASALPLRDKAQKMTLADGQWLLSSISRATARHNGDSVGRVHDVIADTDGKLVSLSLRQGDATREVPAAAAAVAGTSVELAQ